MTAVEPIGKSRDSLHLDDREPSSDWSTEDLGAAAAAEFALLMSEEKSVAARYWRLGRLLGLARKPLTHGQWGCFLKQWRIDRTRAAKALKIFKGFANAEAAAELTVAEACKRSAKSAKRRKQRKQTKKAATDENSSSATVMQSWSQFVNQMTTVVERQLEEPEFLTPQEAATTLVSLERLLTALHACEEQLRRRASAATTE